MRIPRIDPKDATGLVDKVVGLGKEITGEFFDRTRLIEAGEAQQAKANAHDAKAKAYDAKERSAQRTKTG